VTATANKDWNPGAYAKFRGLRLRPALDLMAQVGTPPPGPVVDLGCGDGAAAAALRAAFPARALIGIDNSPAMLKAAQGYDALHLADIAAWQPETPPALIFSNAVLQWLPDHARLMPHLAGMLPKGGVLAVQMPGQTPAPSHRLLRDTAAALFPERFGDLPERQAVAKPEDYWRRLSPLGNVLAWETTYVQQLGPVTEGHPVRAFTESTAMRPYLERLDGAEVSAFRAAYDAALARAYPLLPDGGALLPFRRVFFVFVKE